MGTRLHKRFLNRRAVLYRDEAAKDTRNVEECRVSVPLRLTERLTFGVLITFTRFVKSRLCLLLFLLKPDQFLFQRGKVFNRIVNVLRREFVKRLSVIHGASVGLRIELEQRASERGLTAARFTDQTEGLAFINIHVDTVVRLDIQPLGAERKVLLQIGDFKENFLFAVILCHFVFPPYWDRSSVPAAYR